jgi:hypothetical protein
MAAKQRLPTLVPNASSDAGGLIGYGTDLTEAVRRIAIYVDKIRKGANPADLPFEVFVRPELIVNLNLAEQYFHEHRQARQGDHDGRAQTTERRINPPPRCSPDRRRPSPCAVRRARSRRQRPG